MSYSKKCGDEQIFQGGGHKVKKGETASKIALENKISLKLIKELNPGINLDKINSGDVLILNAPKAKKAEPAPKTAASSAKKPVPSPNFFNKSKAPAQPTNSKQPLNYKSSKDVAKATGLTQKYIEEIMQSEGLKLKTYTCDANKKTIGYGHRTNKNTTITKEAALKLLAEDLNEAKSSLRNVVGNVKLTKAQEEVIVDLIFNGGAPMIENAPALIKALKAGKMDDAACELDFIGVTVNEKGKSVTRVSEGLCIRRLKNMEKFCGGEFSPKVEAKAKTIQQKMLQAYDRRFKLQTSNKNREFINEKRDSSILVSTELIKRCTDKLDEKIIESPKIEEKSLLQKIKDWWHNW